MGEYTGIEWTDRTWNLVTGCTKVSPGCDHCYAETIARRFAGSRAFPDGFTLVADRSRMPVGRAETGLDELDPLPPPYPPGRPGAGHGAVGRRAVTPPVGVLPVGTPRRVTRIEVFDTRPGGRCLPATRRVGAPELPAQATKEIGMVQVHTCVSVRCAQCGDSLGSPGFEAHYPTEDAAVDPAVVAGWRVGPGERWWCSCCGPVLACEDQGHEFTGWRQLRHERGQALREYRYCQRCCLHESRSPDAGLGAGIDAGVAGEVA